MHVTIVTNVHVIASEVAIDVAENNTVLGGLVLVKDTASQSVFSFKALPKIRISLTTISRTSDMTQISQEPLLGRDSSSTAHHHHLSPDNSLPGRLHRYLESVNNVTS